MKTSINGIELIKKFEGYSVMLYFCPARYLTIGYGHRVVGEEKITYEAGISKSIAEEILRNDLVKFENAVAKLIKVPLKQNQFDALVSFVYNLGPAALERSTLRQKINRGDHAGAVREFSRWIYCNGMKLPGLLARRQTEAALYSCLPFNF